MRRGRSRPAAGLVTTKGGSVPQQPARPGFRFAQAAGLTVFVVTLALFGGLFINRVGAGLGSLKAASLAFSCVCAAVAAFGMLFDAFDLWVRGRRMTPYSVKMFRSMVFVAVLGALATSMLAGTALLIVFLGPAMIIYLFIARRPPAQAPSAAQGSSRAGSGRASSSAASSSSAARARQRRGGKKHK